MESNDFNYVYFVSYSYECGYGNIEIFSKNRINSHKEIIDIQKHIEEKHKMSGVIVTYFVIIRELNNETTK